MMKTIQVALIEDDAEIMESLQLIINAAEGFECQYTYPTAEAALASLPTDKPDVVLTDISLPGQSGIACVEQLKPQLPETDFVMLTVHQEDEKVFEALCAGACGYLVKTTPPARILLALREAVEGGAPMSTKIARMVVASFRPLKQPSPLTGREQEVLEQLCEGKSYKSVAEALFVSQDTVRSHIKSIYKKLEVNSKSEAVLRALRDKLV